MTATLASFLLGPAVAAFAFDSGSHSGGRAKLVYSGVLAIDGVGGFAIARP